MRTSRLLSCAFRTGSSLAALSSLIVATHLPDFALASSERASIPRDEIILDLKTPIAPLLDSAKPDEVVKLDDGKTYGVWKADKVAAVQSLIDSAFAAIFSTRAAQKTLLADSMTRESFVSDAAFGLFDGDNQAFKLEHNLGVPFEITTRLIESHGGPRQTRPTAYGEAKGQYQVRPKQYLFLKASDGSAPKFDSYSLENNFTYIFVDPTVTDQLALMKVLAHEVAISGDQKSSLRDVLFFTNAERVGEEEAAKRTPRRLKLQNVNAVFQVLRAMIFERDVLSELFPNQIFGMNAEERSFYSTDFTNEAKCREVALHYAHELARIKYVSEESPQVIQDLFKENSTVYVAGSKTPTCRFATTPFVRWHGYKTEGPRPRVGDWNGKQSQRDKKLQQLSPTKRLQLLKQQNPLLKQRYLKDGVDVKGKPFELYLNEQFSDVRGVPTKLEVPKNWTFLK